MDQIEWERTQSYLIRSLFPDLPHSNQDVITVDSSESVSNDTLEIIRHYNIRRHSMGSIPLSGAFESLSSPMDFTAKRSRSLDPEFEVYRFSAESNVKNTEEINASFVSEAKDFINERSGEQFDVATDLDTNETPETEKFATSGIAASTPKAVTPSEPPSLTSDNELDEFNTARLGESLTDTSNEENEFDEIVSARVSTFPAKQGVKRKRSASDILSRGQKRLKVEMAQPLRDISWDELKNNFFVGQPTVYKLCSCEDHTCN